MAEIEDGAMDHAVMGPEAGFTVADDALIGVDAHEQESVRKEGCDLLDLQWPHSDLVGSTVVPFSV